MNQTEFAANSSITNFLASQDLNNLFINKDFDLAKYFNLTNNNFSKEYVFVQPNSYAGQWHISDYSDGVNVQGAWQDYSGKGVTVGVVDSGIYYSHPELVGKINESKGYFADTNQLGAGQADYAALTIAGEDTHGTFVAGLIAAANNGTGTTGIAFDSTLVSYKALDYLSGTDNIYRNLARAMNLQWQVDISNNSWQTGYYDDNIGSNSSFQDTRDNVPLIHDALRKAADIGRGGLGTSIVFAAGNERKYDLDTNLFTITSSKYVIAVAATDEYGYVADFSTPGASILVSAPGEDITSTFPSITNSASSNYDVESGTSFATPIVSGIIALMLEANPNLGYRDIQEILAYSSKKTDPYGSYWQTNGATNWNGGGLHFSHDLGFGLVDATAAVRLAETWQAQSTYNNEVSHTYSKTANTSMPSYSAYTGISSSILVDKAIDIQHVEVRLNFNHSAIGDLRIELISPNGNISVLMASPFGGYASDDYDKDWVFTTNLNWGENGLAKGSSTGDWKLRIYDEGFASTGSSYLYDWSLTLYGDEISSDNTYIYTNEYRSFNRWSDSSRRTLRDSNGNDTINAAAVTYNTTLNLNADANSIIATNSLKIANGTLIENAFTGDGNDSIIGNSLNNRLNAGRGNDTINGGAGADTLEGGRGNDVYIIDASDVIVEKANEGLDTVKTTGSYVLSETLENLTLLGLASTNGTGNDTNNTIIGNAGNNKIEGKGGNDILSGGLGIDTLSYESASSGISLNLNLVKQQDTFGDGLDTVNGFENVIGSAYNDNIIGNALNNKIEGGAGNDTLNGGLGIDTLSYESASSGISINLALTAEQNTLGAGLDTIIGFENVIGSAYNDNIIGNNLANRLEGGLGNDTLDGGLGNDILIGGLGDDVYYINSPLDSINELAGGGNDTVVSALTYTLKNNFENLTLTGTANLNGTGNALNNHIIGNAGNNILTGGLGVDTLEGGLGNDVYIIDGSDTVIEKANEGLDTVKTTGSYILSETLENLTLIGVSSIDGIGNDTNNIIIGNAGNNKIEGKGGDDILNGGLGIDTLSYENASSAISINLKLTTQQNTLGAGLDTIIGFENVIGSAYNDNIVGNAGNNKIEGGAGNDTIEGGLGRDSLYGADGVDTISYASAGAAVGVSIESYFSSYDSVFGQILANSARGGAGNDVVDGFENIIGSNFNDRLYGNLLANKIEGGAGNDYIDASFENDSIIGGLGNDTLVGGLGNDIFKFAANDGKDTISDFEIGLDKIDLSGWNLANGFSDLTFTIIPASNDWINWNPYADLQITAQGVNNTITVSDYGQDITSLSADHFIFA